MVQGMLASTYREKQRSRCQRASNCRVCCKCANSSLSVLSEKCVGVTRLHARNLHAPHRNQTTTPFVADAATTSTMPSLFTSATGYKAAVPHRRLRAQPSSSRAAAPTPHTFHVARTGYCGRQCICGTKIAAANILIPPHCASGKSARKISMSRIQGAHGFFACRMHPKGDTKKQPSLRRHTSRKRTRTLH